VNTGCKDIKVCVIGFVHVCALTGVDEELVGNSWVVYVMNSCSEQRGKDLQISEDGLRGRDQDQKRDQM